MLQLIQLLRAMLQIPLWNGYFKVKCTKEDPILYMTKLELAYIPVKCWVIDPDVNRLFN